MRKMKKKKRRTGNLAKKIWEESKRGRVKKEEKGRRKRWIDIER